MRKLRKYQAKEALRAFMLFLLRQNKLMTAEDLISGLLYTHVSGIPGCIYRCILWTGINKRAAEMIGDIYNYDAQINVEISPAEEEVTHAFVVKHEPGKLLSDIDSWKFE